MRKRQFIILIGLFLAGLNLRPALASVSPVLQSMQRDLGFGSAVGGLLIAIPVVCMGLFAPAAARIGARVGVERGVLWTIVLIGAATVGRLLVDNTASLLGVTLAVGVGIALCQTLLPSVVKEHFASRAVLVTGVYTAGINLGATLAASATVPFENLFEGSWQAALACWGILAAVALIVWGRIVRDARDNPLTRTQQQPAGHQQSLPWHSVRAWHITAIFGATAFLYFSILTWLAPVYQSYGWSSGRAGMMLSVFSFVHFLTSFTIPMIAVRKSDRRPFFALVIVTAIVGMLMVAFVPLPNSSWVPWLWAALLGFGLGGLFPLALTLPLDYASDAGSVSRLTGMAFGVGYLFGSLGPLAVGSLRDWTGDYTIPFVVLATIGSLQLAATFWLHPAEQEV